MSYIWKNTPSIFVTNRFRYLYIMNFAFLTIVFILLLYVIWKAYQKDRYHSHKGRTKKILRSACLSAMRGAAAGFITGGPVAALTSGVIFGVSAPLITGYEELA
jgi:hypothetical protein